jgi:hypothetical protein
MRENNKTMAEEIAKIVWHPSRMHKWPEDHLIYDSDKDTIQNPLTIRDIKQMKLNNGVKKSIDKSISDVCSSADCDISWTIVKNRKDRKLC